MTTVVLLSGGLDSTVALFYCLQNAKSTEEGGWGKVHALTFNYGQTNTQELMAVGQIWRMAKCSFFEQAGDHKIIPLHHPNCLASKASIMGRSEINKYDNVGQATEHTLQDRAYIPLRNAVFLSIAANHLLEADPEGGFIVPGTRDREGGFADCSREFMHYLSTALMAGSGQSIMIYPALARVANSREETIELGRSIPGCWTAISYTTSCYDPKPPCGHCLPCLRRAQAFKNVNLSDPANGY